MVKPIIGAVLSNGHRGFNKRSIRLCKFQAILICTTIVKIDRDCQRNMFMLFCFCSIIKSNFDLVFVLILNNKPIDFMVIPNLD